MKIGRNERCPCGSGKKYKQCCEQKNAEQNTRWSKFAMFGVAGAMALGLGGFAVGLANVGEANDGRVWSAEHGHWHNADGTELGTVRSSAPAPQPPGEAPPGKVWSPEHGHWHDANGGGH